MGSDSEHLDPELEARIQLSQLFSGEVPEDFGSIMDYLKQLHEMKDRKYGNQGYLLKHVMNKIAKEMELQIQTDDTGGFHFSMELMAKLMRYFNVRYGRDRNKVDAIECLRDLTVYAAMIIKDLVSEIQSDAKELEEKRHASHTDSSPKSPSPTGQRSPGFGSSGPGRSAI